MDIEPLGGYAFSSEARNAPLLHGMDETDQPFVSVMVDFEAERGWIRKVRNLLQDEWQGKDQEAVSAQRRWADLSA